MMKITTLLFTIMSLMLSYNGELIRYNPANSHIEYSNNQGRSWYLRNSGDNIGKVKSIIECNGELILCSDKGVFYSNNAGRAWYTRNNSYKNFIDLNNTGSELLANTDDGHLYYSNNQGRAWYRRK